MIKFCIWMCFNPQVPKFYDRKSTLELPDRFVSFPVDMEEATIGHFGLLGVKGLG